LFLYDSLSRGQVTRKTDYLRQNHQFELSRPYTPRIIEMILNHRDLDNVN